MRTCIRWMVSVLAVAAIPADAQGYPTRPVRFIVPYAAGGSSDIIARLYGQRLSETLGQTFVVDNRPGAGGVVGTEIVAKSLPDGYTLLLQDMPHTINPAVYGKVPYDPVKDFTPITLVARAPQWLFLNPTVPAKSTRELIAIAKAQPGSLKIGSAGNGSGTHLMAELLMHGAGVELTHVPYKGAGPAVTATVAGEMNAVFTSMPAAIGFVQSGRLRPVGVTTAKRHPSHPEVPTFEESGVPNMVLHHWFGVLAPAGLPPAIQAKLVKEFTAAVSYPAIAERYRNLILEPATLTPDAFRKLIQTDLARWSKVVREAGIKAQ
ncbi:MAG TPA: tripartite tricarboxylate transporter substrate binding protein [Burkholderiales bacterium]|nr:tripartite tricarboxylate transporter substrate binding protein [Burkholderiales bacterium]